MEARPSSVPAVDSLLLPATGVAAGLFVAQQLASLLGRQVLPPLAFESLDMLSKACLLGLAAGLSWRCAARLEAGNPMRPVWSLMAVGLLLFLAGELTYLPYQLSLRPAPYPSAADVLFFAAYPALIAALFAARRAYGLAGYAVETGGAWLAAIVGGFGLVTCLALPPVVAAPAPPLEKLLNVAYPLLDIVLMVPAALLIRSTRPMKGGAIHRAWVALLWGLVAMAAGDVVFGYVSTLKQGMLDPLNRALYILGYGLTARGVLHQYRLLTPGLELDSSRR
jgi:hypothetical protein